MYKAVFIKEWIKTKGFVIAILLISVLLYTYMFLKLGRSVRFAGLVHLWDVIITRDQFVFRDIKWFPVTAGLLLGLAQFVPEMYQKRLKLALHLPVKGFRIISWQVSYGITILLGIFILNIAALLAYMSFYFAGDFIVTALYTIFPWYLAGIAAYILTAWIVLEPSWRRRALNILIAVPVLNMLLITSIPAAYINSLTAILLITVFIVFFIYLSVARFKEGVQDK